jgi:signal transduction histidine kinase/DNA-binding response OmpR family regulator
MRIKNIKVKTQLLISFSIIIFFVLVFGVISYFLTYELQKETETIYTHPLEVNRTTKILETEILKIQVAGRDLMLARTEEAEAEALEVIWTSDARALKQFDILENLYLGPAENIEEAYIAYNLWKNAWKDAIEDINQGNIEIVKAEIVTSGRVGAYRSKLQNQVKIIDDFAKNKADSLYLGSLDLKKAIHWQIVGLTLIIMIASIIISFFILKNIRKPLNELTNFAGRFKQGDLDARCEYDYKNEFGTLSDIFNDLAKTVQVNMEINEKTQRLADVMLSEEEPRRFFKVILSAFCRETRGQIGAVYLLSDDQKFFEYYQSVGMDNQMKEGFDVDNLEGEFGRAIIEEKYQIINDIPDDTRFVFQTVSGQFIPKEMMIIPVISGEKIIAMITIASINGFCDDVSQLIDHSISTMSARIEGILAYRKIKEFSIKLEEKNNELDTQKNELEVQSAELIQQNIELEMQKNQLNEASRLKTNFLSNMSHELRTPLNSVIALASVLNRRLADQIPEEEYSYLEIIERNGKNLLYLINDILDISRIEAGREEIEITKFNMNDLVDDVMMMIMPQAKQKKISLKRVSKDNEVFIRSDSDKCKHILQNLIGNAVKFTEKGKVTLNIFKDSKQIHITVKDTGIGIPKKYINTIFEEFRQADGSTSRKFGGTGLGLAIAKKYADLLGGSIGVNSIENQGSEFIVSLPIKYEDENKTEEISGKKETLEYKIKDTLNARSSLTRPEKKEMCENKKNNISKKIILLVEDSEPAVIQIKDLLEQSGYRILVAKNGKEAFNIIDQIIPDAMILDLMMPGIDGFEVLKSIRQVEKTAHIPVLILTAKHITKEDLQNLKRNNVYQLIQKGDINRLELEKAVEKMVFLIKPTEIKETKESNEKTNFKNRQGKPIVLVVEDNEDNMITVNALLREKYTVIEAINGNEAIAKTKAKIPDLILMDIALPGMDGIETLKAMRRIDELKNIPVIALTASVMTDDRKKIETIEFSGFIPKPIIGNEFHEIINEVLNVK